jgi:hypothetical protein
VLADDGDHDRSSGQDAGASASPAELRAAEHDRAEHRPGLRDDDVIDQEKPARPEPIWTSHGRTSSGGASIVIARVEIGR